MKQFFQTVGLLALLATQACTSDDDNTGGFEIPNEEPSSFTQVSKIELEGGEGAAEIAAFDAKTNQLFVVNNAGDSRIDVVDFSDPTNMSIVSSIDITSFGGGVNSVAVGGDYLAAAIEADESTDNGKVVVWNTSDLSKVAEVETGALPDMVTFSPDAKYILAANEGEPSDDYSVDPKGGITIIEVGTFYETQLNFTSFNNEESSLEAAGFRVAGLDASLDADVEPEYISVSSDSKTAYIALQENNGLAIVDIASKSITDLVALGTKDYNALGLQVDPSDKDNKIELRDVPANIYGVYQPDAIATFNVNGAEYIISANEGDGREYFYDADEATCDANGGDFDEEDGCLSFTDESRLKKLDLDPVAFPNADEILLEENFGRWKVMTTEGDLNQDGLYEKVYTYGARSFSIWDANGQLVFDSGDDLDRRAIAAGVYEDGRSDDKSVEPEGVVVGSVNNRMIAFVGLERVDAVAVYDVTTPSSPVYLSMLSVGDAPEGMLFINAEDSPTGESILVVTCEDDGTVYAFSPKLIEG
ncbi:choice-of-anchor I family protein [Sediminitomix flava]|uniref:Choice-of-anchor I domain-containing protein n=1 Tax=Sediminitomix flava TaxID=379075 RepID=A0A315Z5M2_SEDFL|nr:choice-of-anchor I family protein [Sediminitomix flava]PWJ39147.1 hypothetical protein BC781_10648 [Sediminitomix flava]